MAASLTPALQHLDNEALRAFFANLSVPSHIEPGGRKVYPRFQSGPISRRCLVRRMRELGVTIFTGFPQALWPPLNEDQNRRER